MARISEARVPAAPVSHRQAARREAILAATAELGGRDEFDQVQMHDVARAAGVAIGTLYRYFPSKTTLFAAVMRWRMEEALAAHRPDPAAGPADRAAGAMVALTRALLADHRLAEVMMHSAAGEHRPRFRLSGGTVESVLGAGLVGALGFGEPGPDEVAIVRFLVFSWWGVLIAVINDDVPLHRAEDELRLAARLLLASYADRRGAG